MIAGRRGTAIAGLLATGIALLVVASGFRNGFGYDDVALLVNDTRLHEWASLPARLVEPYWPSGLFRPVTLAGLGLQWMAGDGSPVPFRVVSSLLYAAVTAGVLLLALRAGAPRPAALLGAILFAVHPVHSEVTANIVGQAELWSALAAIGAVGWYLKARTGPGLAWGDWAIVTLLFLLSAHAKEGGFVVPGLLLAAELLVVRDPAGPATRLASLRAPALAMVAVMLGALALRASVLGGVGGETPHLALAGLSLPDRAVAMLAVVPEWARLLLWPARLQAEYGPPGLVASPAISGAHLLGLGWILLALVALAWSWHRAPLVAFGMAWMAVSLAPVANVIFPTGILLAERTLFLPSVGLVLVFAGLAGAAEPWLARRPLPRILAIAGILLAATAGGVHSARRQPQWRDTLTILQRTATDAPSSYRAQLLLGKELLHRDEPEAAEAAFRRAAALWSGDPRPFEELGQLLRSRGNCREAIPVLAAGVAADSTSDVARSRLVECLIVERQWDEAEREIRRGMAQGVTGYQRSLGRVVAGREADVLAVP